MKNNLEKFEGFLRKYDEQIKRIPAGKEHSSKALISLLEFSKKDCAEIIGEPFGLHKMFRSVVVVDSSLDGSYKIDSAIWHLIHACPIFWNVFTPYFLSEEDGNET